MKKSQNTLYQTSFDLSNIYNNRESKNIKDRWKKSRLYISVEERRGVQNKLTFADVFSERFDSPKIGLTRQIKKRLVDQLNTLFPESGCKESDVTLKWDQYAGCTCRCSPGYVIGFSDNVNVPYSISHGGNFSVSVSLDENEKGEKR
jgi:hypothetical protein